MMRKIYLNNAATSYPKPESVIEAVTKTIREPPVEAGRSGVGRDPTSLCRELLASLFGLADPFRVVLTPSATYALNTVCWGFLRAGDHVVTTVLEHNSLLRPLAHLKKERGIEVSYIEPNKEGKVEAAAIKGAIRENTTLIAISHASNVTGSVQPIESIAKIASEQEISLLIDASQSAGAVALDYDRLPGRNFVAFACHKGLMGPTGTGALLVPDGNLRQSFVGGTGIRSENPLHPEEFPLRHEAGTPNLPGIAGLIAGSRFVLERGVEQLGRDRDKIVQQIRGDLRSFEGIELLPLADGDGRAGIVSFTISNWSPQELGFLLEESFGIEVRTGLHCAPLIHEFLGTTPLGCIRVSVGPFTSDDEVAALLNALRTICR